MKIETVYIQGLNKAITFWVGTSKEDNHRMIDAAESTDIWFHANNISSCHVICKVPYDIDRNKVKYIIKMGSLLCKNNTNKLKSLSKVEIVYCHVKNIKKTDFVGCVNVTNGKYIII